jgi:hypothetical protein
VLCAVWVFQNGSWTSYLVAGAAIGLAAGAKYTAVFVAASLVVAAVLAKRREALVRLPVAGLIAGAAFLLSTPFALLDRQAFLAGLEFERKHYAAGHDGMEGDTVGFYLDLLVSREGVLVLAALAGLVAVGFLVRDRWPVAAILLAFPVVYGISVSMQTVRNDRTIMLILPPLAVLAAFLVERLRGRAVVAGGVSAAALVVAITTTWPKSGPTTWSQALDWLADSPGATLLVESYGPYPDPDRFEVIGRMRLIDGEIPADVDFLVASEGIYGRYLTGGYPAEESAYKELFDRYAEAARFSGNGSTIVILSAR